MKIRDRIKSLRRVRASELRPNARNWRTHPRNQHDALRGVLAEVGYADALLARELPDGTLELIDGHLRAEVTPDQEVPVLVLDVSEAEADKILATHDPLAAMATADEQKLGQLLADLEVGSGAVEQMLTMLAAEHGIDTLEDGRGEGDAPTAGALKERFGAPPFTVLDARQGYWKERKRAWLSLGIQSELGRGTELNRGQGTHSHITEGTSEDIRRRFEQAGYGASVFDPVLCELAYQWFCPPGGLVLDSFAGGSVRGIVASKLGRCYVGVDLRKEQVDANRGQAERICSDPMPIWHAGDSRDLDSLCGNAQADFVFTCPPYHDLEIYSDATADLSNMDYADFLTAYRKIIGLACDHLKDNRFACIVVGEVRDKEGNYRNLVSDTIRAFCDAGLAYYNEAILVTPIGSLPVRVGQQFQSARKLGKTHQNVLVFIKGDAAKATQAVGPVQVIDPAQEFGEVAA